MTVKGVVTNRGYKYPNNLTFSWFGKVAQSCNINLLLPRVTVTDAVPIVASEKCINKLTKLWN